MESRLHDYADIAAKISGKRKVGWEIAKLAKGIEAAFTSAEKIVELGFLDTGKVVYGKVLTRCYVSLRKGSTQSVSKTSQSNRACGFPAHGFPRVVVPELARQAAWLAGLVPVSSSRAFTGVSDRVRPDRFSRFRRVSPSSKSVPVTAKGRGSWPGVVAPDYTLTLTSNETDSGRGPSLREVVLSSRSSVR